MSHDAHDEVHAGPTVLGVSEKNPKVRTVRLDRSALGAERTFLPGILKGLGVTARHFFQNLWGNARGKQSDIVTVEYPDVKPPYPPRFRGVHRLMLREDGTPRCVACMLCPTVCPAHCITIHPGERADSNEKFPVIFEIDEFKCVVCGLCVEACPCDAIRMDTGNHMPPVQLRGDGVLGKIDMMKLGTLSTATQGGVGEDWDEKEAGYAERGPESRVPATPR
jgi:NADH-quinone oxidoreductase subunit I